MHCLLRKGMRKGYARLQNEDGVALLITLLVVTLLVVMVLEFNYQARVETEITANFRDGTKAYYLARSGVHFAAALLKEDTENTYDALTEDWAQEIPPLPLGDGTISLRIIDEERKFDLNRLVQPNGITIDRDRVTILENLFDILDLDPRLVDPILDWITPAGDQRPSDIPTFDYGDRGYESKHAPLDLVSELQLIQGFSKEVLLRLGGKPLGEGVDFTLSDYLTTFSKEGKINVNTASKEVLQSLSADITEGMAEEILLTREETPFERIEALQSLLPGIYESIKPFITVSSHYYTVVATGTVGEISKEIIAVLKKGDQQIEFVSWQVR